MSAFDPFAYATDVRANPQNYCKLEDIITDAKALRDIREAKTLQALKEAWQAHHDRAKAAGDTLLVGWLREAKDKCKKALEVKLAISR